MRLEERVIEEKVKGVRRNDLVYALAKFAIRFAFFVMNYKITTEGLDQIPEKGRALLVFHHVLLVDPPFLMWALERPINGPGKKELFRWPVWNWIITSCGAYPIDRFGQGIGTNLGAVKYSLNLLKLDEIIYLAPEATRSRDKIGKLRPEMLISLEKRISCPIIVCGIQYPENTGEIPGWGSKISLRFSRYNIWEDGKLKTEEVIAEELGQLLSKLSDYDYDPTYDPLEAKYVEEMGKDM